MDPYERTDWCEECGETYADCECDEQHVTAEAARVGAAFGTRIGAAAGDASYLGKAMVTDAGHTEPSCVVGRNAPRSTILAVLGHAGVVL